MEAHGRILIADDEETFLESTADLLRERGYVCTVASDAQSAVELIKAQEFDLLIADIKMPGNPDLELIKGLPAIADGLPAILVTGYPSLQTAAMSTRLPVAGYLVKPLDFDELLEIVHGAIVRYRTHRMFARTRQSLQQMVEEISETSSRTAPSPDGAPHVSVDDFLHFTLHNLLGSLRDLRDLVQGLAHHSPKQDACQLLNCPRHAEMSELIRETVFVLEKTKTSFKSKELGALRKKLDKFLSNAQI